MRLEFIISCLLFLSLSSMAETLTTAHGVAAYLMNKDDAPVPVSVEADVTFQDPGGTIFLRDDSGVTFIRAAKDNPRVAMGERLRITGVTHNGLFIGGIKPSKIERLGGGNAVVPRMVSPEELASGAYHYHLVSISGVGRSLRLAGENSTILRIVSAGKIVELRFDEALTNASALVDAELRVSGLAAGDINDHRQIVMPYVRVRSMEDVEILKPPPSDPYAEPLVPLGSLQQASAGPHRVRIRGTALSSPLAGGIFLRDDSHSVFVQVDAPEIRPGDVVEALGFAEMGVFSAQLSDAECRIVGVDTAPSPTTVTPKELSNGSDASLIATDAHVLQRLDRGDQTELVAQTGTINLNIFVPSLPPAEVTAESMIHISGVCRVSATHSDSYRAKATGYSVWLGSANDLVLLQHAPWWTSRRLALGLIALALIALLAFAWIALLRRQVSKQLQQIHRQAQTEAVQEERQRIAREFHDTLEQELAGLSLRLDAASTRVSDEKARALLEQQRKLLSRLQTETRDFVWDLRDPTRVDMPLPLALRSLLDHLQTSTPVPLKLQCDGTVGTLTPLIQHHLLRITREAVHNAIKYANSTGIEVTLDCQPDLLRLVITDNGKGFNVGTADLMDGHFGIRGMRERTRKIGAELRICSNDGVGSSVELTLPLPAMRA